MKPTKRPPNRLNSPLPILSSSLATPGVHPSQIHLSRHRLGQGTFGSVYRGTFSGCPVAIKICSVSSKPTHTQTAAIHFRREMCRYQHLRHPCITQFFCVVQHPETNDLLLVTELMKGGTLFSALQRLRNASVSILPTEALLRIAQHVTNGLAYLHASSFSFGDLKSMNVLLSELPDLDAGTFPPFTQAKLCDFGLSRNLKHVAESAPHSTTSNHTSDVCSTPPPSRGPAGTFAYLAPEAFSGLPTANAAAAKAADVYALGIVLWELATLQRPWPYKQALQLIRLVRKEGRRPEWPVEVIAGLPKGYVSLAERCWHQNAGCRPVVDEVARELEQMYTQTDVDDVPLWAAFGRGSGISATSSGVVDGDMSGDLDAVRVDDDGEGVDVSRECYVKEIRELDCNELNVSHSEMSEVTTVHGGGRLSQSRLSVDSFTPDADCGEVENVKYEMTKMNDSEGKEQRDDRNEQDEQDGQDDHVQEREYKVPMCKQDCAGLDNELRILEARDNLDVDDVGVCMFSRPHFR